jgi:hypothetical protein
MPPIRSQPAANRVRNERSHEESRERYAAPSLLQHGLYRRYSSVESSAGIHQVSSYKQNYSPRSNSKRKKHTLFPSSETVSFISNTSSIASLDRASAPLTSASDATCVHSTADSTLFPRGYEIIENNLYKVNICAMGWLRDFVGDKGPDGSIEPSESRWDNFEE